MEKIIDRRARKMKKSIHVALAKLLLDNDVHKITVKKLSDTADINRKTFYNYYSNIDSVLDEMINEVITNFYNSIEDAKFETTLKDSSYIFSNLNEFIEKNFAEYFFVLKNGKIDTNKDIILNKLGNAFKKHAVQFITKNVNAKKQDIILVSEYCTSGILSIFKYWLDSDGSVSLEDITERINSLTSLCFNSIITH